MRQYECPMGGQVERGADAHHVAFDDNRWRWPALKAQPGCRPGAFGAAFNAVPLIVI